MDAEQTASLMEAQNFLNMMGPIGGSSFNRRTLAKMKQDPTAN